MANAHLTSAPAAKAFSTGTHRTRHPEQTWSIVAPHLMSFGITRVADVTGLDTLGIPVAMAVRPAASSSAVRPAAVSAVVSSGALARV